MVWEVERSYDLSPQFISNCVGVLSTIGYCIIPCIQGLVKRLAEIDLSKQTLVSYQQNNLFLLDTVEQDSQLRLTKFEKKSE
jgi:hypothetical protein